MGAVVLGEKKLFAGLLWKERITGDLKADFEATPTEEASLNCRRMMNDILNEFRKVQFNIDGEQSVIKGLVVWRCGGAWKTLECSGS